MFDRSFTFNSLWSWNSLRSWKSRWSWNPISSTISWNCGEESHIKGGCWNRITCACSKMICDAHFSLRFLVFLVGLDYLNYTCDISCYPYICFEFLQWCWRNTGEVPGYPLGPGEPKTIVDMWVKKEASVNEFFRTSGHLMSLLVQQVPVVQVALLKIFLYEEQQD